MKFARQNFRNLGSCGSRIPFCGAFSGFHGLTRSSSNPVPLSAHPFIRVAKTSVNILVIGYARAARGGHVGTSSGLVARTRGGLDDMGRQSEPRLEPAAGASENGPGIDHRGGPSGRRPIAGRADAIGPVAVVARAFRDRALSCRERLDPVDRVEARPAAVDREPERRSVPMRCARGGGACLRPGPLQGPNPLAARPGPSSTVASNLVEDWSPAHISVWRRREFQADEAIQVSHEKIFRSLFVQVCAVPARRRCINSGHGAVCGARGTRRRKATVAA